MSRAQFHRNASQEVKVLLHGLYFANGAALSPDEKGNTTRSLHDPTGAHLKEITSALEHDGHLYRGSLHNDRIGKYNRPES